MKHKTMPLLALASLALCAQGAQVSSPRAAAAAETWVGSGATMDEFLGGAAERAQPVCDAAGVPLFYAVSMSGGGVVVLAADDTIGPVLAFTPDSQIDLSEGSPMRALLVRDVEVRKAVVEAEAAASARSGSRRASAGASFASAAGAKALWETLAPSAEASASSARASAAASGRPDNQAITAAVNDIRVRPLLQSEWNQSSVDAKLCYNYYTPNNYPCGCIATACAQIMRYWEWPSEDCNLAAFTNAETTVDGEPVVLKSVDYPLVRRYDWTRMEYKPTGKTLEGSRAAIGRLTSDIGVAVGMSYAASGSGTVIDEIARMFRNKFEYPGVFVYSNYNMEFVEGKMQVEVVKEDGLHLRELRDRAIYSNLDAGMPVFLAISSTTGAGGHAVVADGYGFMTIDYGTATAEYEFAHINVGWGGQDNMWYNLPVVSPPNTGSTLGGGGMKFDILSGAVFNIHPDCEDEVLSGRVLYDGQPVEGALVEICYAGTDEVAAEAVYSGAAGIYSFFLPGGTNYDITATCEIDGAERTQVLAGVALGANLANEELGADFMIIQDAEGLGNSWGNDIDLAADSVRIDVESLGESVWFKNLESAIDYAATNETEKVKRITVVAPTQLNRARTITADLMPDDSTPLEIVCEPGGEYAGALDCPVRAMETAFVSNSTIGGVNNTWALQIDSGASVLFSNIVFETESSATVKPPLFDVQAAATVDGVSFDAGRMLLAGDLGLGAIVLRDPSSLSVVAPVSPAGIGIGVYCDGCNAEGDAFGLFEGDVADVAPGVEQIVNLSAPDSLRGRAVEDPDSGEKLLVWTAGGTSRAEDANAYFITSDGGVETTNCFYSLDALFAANTGLAEVKLLRDIPGDAFTNTVSLAGSLVVSAEEGTSPAFAFGGAVGKSAFVLSGGEASLCIKGAALSRSGAAAASLVKVDGGAAFSLEDGASIEGVRLAATACAVEVAKGSFSMKNGAAVENCTVNANATAGKPSIILLKGAGCSFDIQDSSVSGCAVKKESKLAGAVYAVSGSSVSVSGGASVSGNTITYPKTGAQPGNIYLENNATLEVADAITSGEAAIGVYSAADKFAQTSIAPDDATLLAFANDRNSELCAAADEDGVSLVWAERPAGANGEVDEADAIAGVACNSTTNWYDDVGAAFLAATNAGSRVFLCADSFLTDDISVAASNIVLDGAGFTLFRTAPMRFEVSGEGASLSVTNTVIDGGSALDPEWDAPVYGRLFTVQDGASLEFQDGTAVSNVVCTAEADVAPVVVWGGTFAMKDGASISFCSNTVVRTGGGPLAAAAIVANGHSAHPTDVVFDGGTVANCHTASDSEKAASAAVYIANGASVYIQGATSIAGNTAGASAISCNVVCQDKSELWLMDGFEGDVGYTEGILGDTNFFGRVSAEYAAAATPERLDADAANFHHDKTDASGIAVKNADSDTRLVWDTAFAPGSDTLVVKVKIDGVEVETEWTRVTASSQGGGETVVCEQVYIASISKSADGANWELVLTNGTLRCSYVLKSSTDLSVPLADWDEVDSISPLEAFEGGADGEAKKTFVFRPAVTDEGRRFWYVEGRDGTTAD